ITDIFVDRYDKINVMRNGVLEKTDCVFDSEDALVSLVVQLKTTLNQNFGLETPILDARLPDGSRLNCTHQSVTPQGTSMSLRKLPATVLSKNYFIGKNCTGTLRDDIEVPCGVTDLSKYNFIDSGMLTEEMLAYLVGMIERKDIFIISGNMGS